MYIGNLEQLDFISYLSPELQKIIAIVKDKLSMPLEAGKHELYGDNAFFILADDHTQLLEERRSEAHRDYLDVQIVLEGEETFGYSLSKFAAIEDDQLDERDLSFSSQVIDERFITLTPGEFIIFYPGQPHRPLVATDKGPAPVRKAIIKVNKRFL
uniref:YhcH/YjgK/YiaL family protein n=1 Tax=Thaumasiovibrio occultus TaxID=1891184 RepID=UPI000B3529C6|nr:YhcH/YjgK/YiaL family protein [Thaumasiovibrio occultus]